MTHRRHHPPKQVAPTSGEPTVLWNADHEAGNLNEYAEPDVIGGPNAGGGEFNDGDGDTVISAPAAITGLNGIRQTATAGAGNTRMFRWKEAKENNHWIAGMWRRIPNVVVIGTPDFFCNIQQIKSVDPSGTPSRVAFTIQLKTRDGANGPNYLYVAQFNPDTEAFIQDHNPPANVNLPSSGTPVWIEMEVIESATATGRIVVSYGTDPDLPLGDRNTLTTVVDIQDVITKSTGHDNHPSWNMMPGAGTVQNGLSSISIDGDDAYILLPAV